MQLEDQALTPGILRCIAVIHADEHSAAEGVDDLVRMVMAVHIGLDALFHVAGGVEQLVAVFTIDRLHLAPWVDMHEVHAARMFGEQIGGVAILVHQCELAVLTGEQFPRERVAESIGDHGEADLVAGIEVELDL